MDATAGGDGGRVRGGAAWGIEGGACGGEAGGGDGPDQGRRNGGGTEVDRAAECRDDLVITSGASGAALNTRPAHRREKNVECPGPAVDFPGNCAC